jgi:sialic acid synthase SpsE
VKQPFIVAEISANHLGSYSRAAPALVDIAAADACADAVKFQLYDPDKMAPAGLVIESWPVGR